LNVPDRIEAFARLGSELKEGLSGGGRNKEIQQVITEAGLVNPWFTRQNLEFSLKEISRILEPARLEKWMAAYPGISSDPVGSKEVGVVLAGNIPLAGFHDFLSVLMSGNRFKGKLSAKDDILLPFLARILISHQPDFEDRIVFVEDLRGSIDAVIATGSNNTTRYFEYYFGRYPHIFRKNRNGIAILTGKESDDDLSRLADDIFLYFGLGCRNIAKIYVPEKYDFDIFYRAMEKYSHLQDHHKYANNYQYYRSVWLMNRVEHLDNGFLILKRDRGLSSPVGTLYYDDYTELEELAREIETYTEDIQCMVASPGIDLPVIPFGTSQHPEPWDYADDVDTLNFLSNLYKK
jgi:hypothetical protein